MRNQRNSERFEDFARVICDELCIVSGVLIDISKDGFKAEFNAPCTVDSEKEYLVQIRLSRVNAEPLDLLVQPMWHKFYDGKTSIGFSILRTKDATRFENYVKMLKQDKLLEDDTSAVSLDTDSLFI